MSLNVVTRGERELALRLETYPNGVRDRLEERITDLTERLQDRVEAAAPYRTGKLRSEIKGRVFASQGGESQRIAGYVSVYAPGQQSEYAKAATLEYGSDKPRRIFGKANLIQRLGGDKKRFVRRMTRPVHIPAFAYLRNPLEEMRPEIEAELDDALTDPSSEGS